MGKHLSRPKVTEAQARGTRRALEPLLSTEQRATIARTDAQIAHAKAAHPKGLFEKLRDRKQEIDQLSTP